MTFSVIIFSCFCFFHRVWLCECTESKMEAKNIIWRSKFGKMNFRSGIILFTACLFRNTSCRPPASSYSNIIVESLLKTQLSGHFDVLSIFLLLFTFIGSQRSIWARWQFTWNALIPHWFKPTSTEPYKQHLKFTSALYSVSWETRFLTETKNTYKSGKVLEPLSWSHWWAKCPRKNYLGSRKKLY